jgi:hypothetical protein
MDNEKKKIPPVPPVKEKDQSEDEDTLDKTIADSFPASDPPSSIPDPDESEDAA